MNNSKFLLIAIIALNSYLLFILKVDLYGQILNIMISYGIFDFYKERKFLVDKVINKYQILLSFFLLITILYRSYWLHIGDNFIYLLLPSFLIIFALFSNHIRDISLHFRPIFISFLFAISKILFIPLSIIITPLSTVITWLVLNAFGFYSLLNGQEIYYNSPGIYVTFSCSGSGQILFCLAAMIILNICFPLNSLRLFLVQLSRALLFTFSANILRLFLLAVYSYTFDSEGFSIFRYLHGGTGGLFFSFASMILSCESYKRIYLRRFEY